MTTLEKFKPLSFQAKIEFIWDYFRYYILFAICIIILLITYLTSTLSSREPLLNIIMMDSAPDVSPDGLYSFLEQNGYEVFDEAVSLIVFPSEIYMDFESIEALTVFIAAGGQDLLLGKGERFHTYANGGELIDLSSVIHEDLLTKYSSQLIYTKESNNSTPYPCAISISNNNWMAENGYYGDFYIGILQQPTNQEIAIKFIEFLLSE